MTLLIYNSYHLNGSEGCTALSPSLGVSITLLIFVEAIVTFYSHYVGFPVQTQTTSLSTLLLSAFCVLSVLDEVPNFVEYRCLFAHSNQYLAQTSISQMVVVSFLAILLLMEACVRFKNAVD